MTNVTKYCKLQVRNYLFYLREDKMVDAIEIQSRLKRLNRSQKYLSKVFKRPESHISTAIHLDTDYTKHFPRFIKLRAKIISHIEKLEDRQNGK